jgi:hypothetical protein
MAEKAPAQPTGSDCWLSRPGAPGSGENVFALENPRGLRPIWLQGPPFLVTYLEYSCRNSPPGDAKQLTQIATVFAAIQEGSPIGGPDVGNIFGTFTIHVRMGLASSRFEFAWRLDGVRPWILSVVREYLQGTRRSQAALRKSRASF